MMAIQVDRLTLGQTIQALKKTSEGLTRLEVEFPDKYIIRKIMTMKQLVDNLYEQELIFEGNGETNYKS
jgi:hypothetical protein